MAPPPPQAASDATPLPPTLRLLVMLLVRTKHLICAIYFAITVFVYMTVSTSDLRAAQAYAPSAVSIIQAVLAFLHMFGLEQSTCRLLRKQQPTRKAPLWWQATSSSKLAFFHCIDMGCASYQALRMARYLVDHRQSVVYACVASLYCLVTPWFLFVKHESVRTSTVLFLNSFLGFILSIGFPLAIFVFPAVHYILFEPSLSNNAKFITANLLVARYALVSSPLDLGTKVVLQLGSYLNLRRLARSVEVAHSASITTFASAIHPSTGTTQGTESQPSRAHTSQHLAKQVPPASLTFDLHSRRFLKLFLAGNCIWGVGLVLIAITASYGRSTCPPSCVYHISPWSDSLCHCVHVDVNCASLGVDGDNVTEFLRGDLAGPSLLNVEFRRCSLTHGIPVASLAPHQELSGIFISHSQMRHWDTDDSVGLPASLTAFQIRGSALTEVPAVLETAPRDLVFLRLESSPIRAIPDRFFRAWVHVSSLSLSDLLLADVSAEIPNMVELVWLELRGNRISTIPFDWQAQLAGQAHGLRWIDVSANVLEQGPWELARGGATLELSSNPLQDLPPSWVVDAGLIASRKVVLDDTPCCNKSGTIAPMCRPKCARQCQTHLIHDYRCDAVCFIPSCNFDGGDCDNMNF